MWWLIILPEKKKKLAWGISESQQEGWMASESIWVNSLNLKAWYLRTREGKMLAHSHTAWERRTRSRFALLRFLAVHGSAAVGLSLSPTGESRSSFPLSLKPGSWTHYSTQCLCRATSQHRNVHIKKPQADSLVCANTAMGEVKEK